MIVAYEGGEEFLHNPVVCEDVDLECEAHIFLAGVEDAFAADNASVVDDDCRVADVFADLGGDGREGGRGGDVAWVVMDVGCCGWCISLVFW